MHSYEPSRQPYQQIPAMRPAYDGPSGPSATPIYDALYSEYRRSFRTLPGDRSGEEDLGFKAFGAGPHQLGHGLGHQQHSGGYPNVWQPAGVRQHAGHHVPAALPPGPRRGL
ncbi:hypothetical protein ACLGI4_23390 [Streptomyces sp. HMX112]|uniref:hypothetical protein n=1 Tax=Streptomyces sp. HMX112 TaxID=3390850 RepID=UPI003A808AE9